VTALFAGKKRKERFKKGGGGEEGDLNSAKQTDHTGGGENGEIVPARGKKKNRSARFPQKGGRSLRRFECPSPRKKVQTLKERA